MPPAGCGHNSGTSAPRSAWLGRAGSSAIAPVLFFRDVAQDRRQEIDVAHDVPHARQEAAGTRAIPVLCIDAVVEVAVKLLEGVQLGLCVLRELRQPPRSDAHTSDLQSIMRKPYAAS